MTTASSSRATIKPSKLWALTVIMLVGAAFRIAILTEFRLHPDEALFATLGRLIITGADPLLTKTSLLIDKPPLFYYTLAAGISIDWVNEMTPRLPSLFASIVSVALIARLAALVKINSVISALVFSLSPFVILFSPTAFADPLMVMWWLAACIMVCQERWLTAGITFGLSLATKQNALFLVPMLGLLYLMLDNRRPVCSLTWFIIGFGIIGIAVIGWDVLRTDGASFWTAGVAYNNPGRLIRQDELIARLVGWSSWLRYLFGNWVGAIIWITGAAASITISLMGRRNNKVSAVAYVLVAFACYYLLLHWLVAFPLLDRYMLPIAVVVALLSGLIFKLKISRYIMLVGTIPLTIGMWQALMGNIPVGSDKGAYDEIVEVSDFVAQQPAGTVVYYQTLGWPLTYYLYDAPVFLVDYGSPQALQADLEAFQGQKTKRLLIVAHFEPDEEALYAIAQAKYSALEVYSTASERHESSFVVYSLQHPTQVGMK